jgi:hypothetical protein
MSGIVPVTIPNPPEVFKTCMWLLCEGDLGCTRCCAMSAALVPRSYACNQRCVRCAHQLSERANASSLCLNINHKPLKTNKNVVVEACKRWRRCPVGLQGEMEGLCWAMASPIFQGAGASPHMYSMHMLPHKQNIVPPPRILL